MSSLASLAKDTSSAICDFPVPPRSLRGYFTASWIINHRSLADFFLGILPMESIPAVIALALRQLPKPRAGGMEAAMAESSVPWLVAEIILAALAGEAGSSPPPPGVISGRDRLFIHTAATTARPAEAEASRRGVRASENSTFVMRLLLMSSASWGLIICVRTLLIPRGDAVWRPDLAFGPPRRNGGVARTGGESGSGLLVSSVPSDAISVIILGTSASSATANSGGPVCRGFIIMGEPSPIDSTWGMNRRGDMAQEEFLFSAAVFDANGSAKRTAAGGDEAAVDSDDSLTSKPGTSPPRGDGFSEYLGDHTDISATP
eukprot:Hpha_TRINITY_DN16903_c2_g7::TRINITY_DN16903_c2_g7_i1::g.53520::m.53520